MDDHRFIKRNNILNMKYIKTFEQLNEGWLTDWIFKRNYKVNYTAELIDKKTDEPTSYRSHVTIKAKSPEEAKEKFYEKWEKAIKYLEHKPTVILGNIKKTNNSDKTSIELPKFVKKDKDKDSIIKIKVKEEPKKDQKKK